MSTVKYSVAWCNRSTALPGAPIEGIGIFIQNDIISPTALPTPSFRELTIPSNADDAAPLAALDTAALAVSTGCNTAPAAVQRGPGRPGGQSGISDS